MEKVVSNVLIALTMWRGVLIRESHSFAHVDPPEDTGPFVPEDEPNPFDSTCAAHAASLFLSLVGHPQPYEDSLRRLPPSNTGTSMADLKAALGDAGVPVISLQSPMSEWPGLSGPFIVYLPPSIKTQLQDGSKVGIGHYIVARAVGQDRVQVLDFPNAMPVLYDLGDFAANWRASGFEHLTILACAEDNAGMKVIEAQTGQRAIQPLVIPPVLPKLSPIRTDAVAGVVVGIEGNADGTTESVDFGRRYEGGMLQIELLVHNTLSEAIEIVATRADCGCMYIRHPDTEVAPGKEALIQVGMNLNERPGAIRHRVDIDYRARTLIRTLSIDLKGDLVRAFRFEPGCVDFGQVSTRENRAIVRRTRVQTPEGVSVTRAKSARGSRRGISATLVSISGKDNEAQIVVQIDPGTLDVGAFAADVRLVDNQGEVVAMVRAFADVRH